MHMYTNWWSLKGGRKRVWAVKWQRDALLQEESWRPLLVVMCVRCISAKTCASLSMLVHIIFHLILVIWSHVSIGGRRQGRPVGTETSQGVDQYPLLPAKLSVSITSFVLLSELYLFHLHCVCLCWVCVWVLSFWSSGKYLIFYFSLSCFGTLTRHNARTRDFHHTEQGAYSGTATQLANSSSSRACILFDQQRLV